MTRLERPVTRDVGMVWRGRPLVVRMLPEGLALKGAGQRWSSAYVLPWAAAYDVAVKMKIAEERRAKAAARKARRA